MTTTVEPSDAPDFAELANGSGIAVMAAYYAPLTTPAGGADLARFEYKEGLRLWTHGRADVAEKAPGILFVHGGGWAGGAPSFHLRHIHELASRGFVTAALEYRLSLAAPWPAQIDDVNAAIDFMVAHADELGLDPARLAIAGGSAGGQLAAVAALTRTDIKAAVTWYPVADLLSFHNHPDLKGMTDTLMPGAAVEQLQAASPVNLVHAGAPPMLTFAGDADAVTTVADIERMHAKLDEAGVRNELVVFKGRDHGFDFHPTDFEVCLTRMSAFLGEVV